MLPREIAVTPGSTAGWVDALVTTAETVEPPVRPMPAALVEETECLLRWLESPGVRLVRGAWRSPWPSAARHLSRFDVETPALAGSER